MAAAHYGQLVLEKPRGQAERGHTSQNVLEREVDVGGLERGSFNEGQAVLA